MELVQLGLVVAVLYSSVAFQLACGISCFECHGTSVSDVTSSCWETVNSEHARFVSLRECESGSCSLVVLNHTSIGLRDFTRSCDARCESGCFETPFGTTLCKYCCSTDRCNAVLPTHTPITHHNDTVASMRNLRHWLKELFSKARHHTAGPSVKFHMRHEITKVLRRFVPDVAQQEVEVSEVHAEDRAPENFRAFIRTTSRGFNILAVLPGKAFKTSSDEILVVMAHYDTALGTPGVNDNGSGVSVLLELARLTNMEGCHRKFTIVFVASDFKEHGIYRNRAETDSSRCFTQGSFVHNVGSTQFVCHWLLPHLEQYGGKLFVAINMDTLLNIVSSTKSDEWPKEFQRTLRSYSPYGVSFLQAVQRKSFSSDWWMMKSSTSAFERIFSQNDTTTPSLKDSDFLYLQLDTKSESVRSDAMLQLLHADDCAPFHEVSHIDLPCITISDTGRLRGYMKRCHHGNCDTLAQVDDERLENLAKLTNILHRFISEFSQPICENGKTSVAPVSQTAFPRCDSPLIQKNEPRGIFISATCSRSGTSFEMCSALANGIWALLNGDTAWIPRKSRLGKAPLWFQVDFAMPVNVTSIAVQGVRRKGYVRSYMISYSNNERDWEWHIPQEAHWDDINRRAEIRGNTNGHGIVKRPVKPPIAARFIRIFPRWWRKRIAMRFQVYGCHVSGGMRSTE